MINNSHTFRGGMRDGIPIALGYMAVAFSLGIMAAKIGLNPFQGFISALLNHASAGEYAELTAIMSNASYIETALIILVTNSRYLLMSCALSQKFAPDASLFHRLFIGFGITDEIFAISVTKEGNLDPLYSYGAMLVALPSWAMGNALGIIAGNTLPSSVVSALSVAIYGMFLAIIIPPAKKDKAIFGIILTSFAVSFAVSKIQWFSAFPESVKVIVLTVILAGLAAILFPVPADWEEAASEEKQL